MSWYRPFSYLTFNFNLQPTIYILNYHSPEHKNLLYYLENCRLSAKYLRVSFWQLQYSQLGDMQRKEERINERYDSQRNNKFIDYISKQIQSRRSGQNNSRFYSNTNKTKGSHLNSSQIYAQPQITSQQNIPKPRRAVSILRNSSKTKYTESRGKFRKEFIKDSYVNLQYQSQIRKRTKEEPYTQISHLNFDEELGTEELHYQMVRLHQNVKKMQHDS